MNVLMLIPYTPTPIRTRPYNLLRGLLRKGHKVTLATLWEDQIERQQLEEWKSLGATVLACELTRQRKLTNLLKAIPTSKPLQSVYCWEPRLLVLVKENWQKLINKGETYNAVHIEHLRGAPFALSIKDWLYQSEIFGTEFNRPPIIWDSVDCISLLFEKAARASRSPFGRLASAFELPRTRKYEGWLVKQFDQTLVTAEADQAALSDLVVKNKSAFSEKPQYKSSNSLITVLPNGVDLDIFTPNYGERKDATIVMTGKMSYHANITAAFYLIESVMPVVWARCPDAQVQIVGANPPVEIRALASRYPGKVEVTGTVPSIVPYLREATLAAAPIAYGVGIQNKVLEAMACATPVVCTHQAVSALKTQPGRDLCVGGSPSEFAAEVLKLLEDLELRQTIGTAGRKFVEEHHSWSVVVRQLEEIYLGTSNV